MNFNINKVPSKVSFDGMGMFQGVSFLIKEALFRQLYWNQKESKHPIVVLEAQGTKFRIQCPVMAKGSFYHFIEEGKKTKTVTGYRNTVQEIISCSA
jgi:hypothetical protein